MKTLQTLLLVDDHAEARARMRRLVIEALGIHDVRECATLADAAAAIGEQPYDLAILDLSLPDGDGATLIKPLLDENPDCRVVIATIHDESRPLIGALSQGAHGYLLKDQQERDLVAALKGLPAGVPPLSATMTQRILDHLRSTKAGGNETDGIGSDGAPDCTPDSGEPTGDRVREIGATLTEREKEILSLLARGFNRPDIAGMLNISRHTVATHVSNLYGKLEISSRSEAAIAARELGLI